MCKEKCRYCETERANGVMMGSYHYHCVYEPECNCVMSGYSSRATIKKRKSSFNTLLLQSILEKIYNCKHITIKGNTDGKGDFNRVCLDCGKCLPDIVSRKTTKQKLKVPEKIDSEEFFKLCQRDPYFALCELRNKQCEIINYLTSEKKLKV